MGVELPDDPDESPDGNADRRDDQGDSGQSIRPGNSEAETRNREECYVDLRVAVAKEESVTARRVTAGEQAAAEKWVKEGRGIPLDVDGVPASMASRGARPGQEAR